MRSGRRIGNAGRAGALAKVEVTDNVESAGIGDTAIAKLPGKIIGNQSVGVDSVAGATLTSAAIKTAVGDCIKQAGGDTAAYSKAVKPEQLATRKVSCDVLVIGGGGGGLSAAVKAAQAGAKVTLIEKNAALGGDTICNAGTLIATGSRFQKEVLGEKNDSPELAYADIMRVGKNKNDPAMVKMITESIGSTVDWLVDDLGIKYDVAATQYPDHSAKRQIGVVGRSVSWISQMQDIFTKLGGTVMTDTRATSLTTDTSGAVTGAVAQDEQGEIDFTAASVVLASGGYGAESKLLPDTLSGYKFYGRTTDTGDGYVMATDIGADTINLDLVKVYPQGVETVPGRALAATASSTAACNRHGAIYVNSDGDRIVNENATLGELTDITVAQKDKIMYIVMDEKAWQAYVDKSLEDKLVASKDDLTKWANIQNDGKPIMCSGTDLAELAGKMGINAEELADTIKKYNANCASGTDEFGKKSPVALADGGNYYIVEQKPRFCTTLGGLKANTDMAILNKSGQPIANLFGAGCVVGGANGADSMTAMMNSWAIGSGAVAGVTAAKNAGFTK